MDMAEKLLDVDSFTLRQFGGRLKELLKRLNITQKKLAEGIGVAPYTVSLWVRGKANITLTSLYKVIEFFYYTFPKCKVISSLFPDWITMEQKRREKTQRDNAIDRLLKLPPKLRVEVFEKIGIKNWYELFEDPFICEVKRILKN